MVTCQSIITIIMKGMEMMTVKIIGARISKRIVRIDDLRRSFQNSSVIIDTGIIQLILYSERFVYCNCSGTQSSCFVVRKLEPYVILIIYV